MSQISPPIRILLAASLVLIGAWFAFLRPGAEPVTPVTPAPGSGFATAVESAEGAAAAANAASSAAAAQGTTSAPTSTGAGTAAAPAQAAKPATSAAKPARKNLGLPTSVAKAVAKDKTMVMLFWNKNAYDDQAVRDELKRIDRHKGKVAVHVASISDVARYAPITRGVNLEQSPTVVVVKGNSADTLVGYVDRVTIDQTVSDVMRSAKKK